MSDRAEFMNADFFDLICVHPKTPREIAIRARERNARRKSWTLYSAQAIRSCTDLPWELIYMVLEFTPSPIEAMNRTAVINTFKASMVVYFANSCYHRSIHRVQVGYRYVKCDPHYGWSFCSGFSLYNYVTKIFSKFRGVDRQLALKQILKKLVDNQYNFVVFEDYWCPQTKHDPCMVLGEEKISLPTNLQAFTNSRGTLIREWDDHRTGLNGRHLQ